MQSSNNSEIPHHLRTIFISGLNYKTTEQQISDFLKDCGEIEFMKVPKYRGTQKNTGYCHVTFIDCLGYEKALKLTGNFLDGLCYFIK